MAEAGERFDMPDGSTYLVVTPSAATGGEYVEMEFILPPNCVPPPPHIHPEQVESYEVIEGSFDVLVDGTWSTLGPGESASVPVGVEHTFRNRSGQTVRVRNWHRPAVRFEEFIESINRSLAELSVTRPRDPRILMCISAAMLEYSDTLVPSRRRDLIPMKALAWAGRRLQAPPPGVGSEPPES
jgi:mannose-6-phosphate isomerase-like protein (cupin superfamily)